MNTAQKIVKNFLSLTAADLVTRLLGLLVITYLARRMGPNGFGMLSFSISLVNYFAFITDPGIATYGVKSVASNPGETNRWMSKVFGGRLLLSLVSFAVLLLVAASMQQDSPTKNLILLYGLMLFPMALSTGWIYQGLQKMEYIAVNNLVQGLTYTAMIFLFVKGVGQIAYVPLILVFSLAATSLLLLVPVMRWHGVFRPSLAWAPLRGLLKLTVPIGISSFLVCGINWNLSTTMLGFMSNPAEVGYFSAAFKIVLIIIGIAKVFETAVFPALSYYHARSPETMSKIVYFSEKAIVVLGIPLIVGTILTAEPLILAVFGDKYAQSVLPVKILIAGAVLYMMNNIYFTLMLVAERQKENMKISVVRALLLFGISIIFISFRGATGAAAAYTAAELITLLLYWRSVSSTVVPRAAGYLSKPLLPALVMGGLLLLLPGFNVFVKIALAAGAYGAALMVFKGIRKEELAAFVSALSRK